MHCTHPLPIGHLGASGFISDAILGSSTCPELILMHVLWMRNDRAARCNRRLGEPGKIVH